jgi:hypothetical protein
MLTLFCLPVLSSSFTSHSCDYYGYGYSEWQQQQGHHLVVRYQGQRVAHRHLQQVAAPAAAAAAAAAVAAVMAIMKHWSLA